MVLPDHVVGNQGLIMEKEIKKEPETKEPEKQEASEETYETTPMIEKAREEREKTEKATAALKAENDRKEQIQIREELGGQAEAGIQPEPPKEETDVEYAERLKRGEVDPLKDDGFK